MFSQVKSFEDIPKDEYGNIGFVSDELLEDKGD